MIKKRFLTYVHILTVISTLFIFIHSQNITQAQQINSVKGSFDVINGALKQNGTANFYGWAISENVNDPVISIEIYFDDLLIAKTNQIDQIREDVARAFDNAQWAKSGWHITQKLPISLASKKYTPSAEAITRQGQRFKLNKSSLLSEVTIAEAFAPNLRQKALKALPFMLIALFAIAYSGFILALNRGFLLRKYVKPQIELLITIWLVFACFVAAKVHGSQINLLFERVAPQNTAITDNAALPVSISTLSKLFGADAGRLINNIPDEFLFITPRQIRSDEWLVETPYAISQANHIPAFPIINTNLGIQGQNMLIAATQRGVPVWHIAILGRPATWGYLLFGIEHGLAWAWWFPLFACFSALLLFFNLLLGEAWRLAVIGSTWFCGSAFVMAWSLWPAYVVFFPAILAYCFYHVLISPHRSVPHHILLGVFMGLCLAGYVLVLYPPWQIATGYLFTFIVIGLIIRDRSHLPKHIGIHILTTFSFTIIVASVLLLFFYIDAREAISTMTQTVYPGQRVGLTGGTYPFWRLLAGNFNFVTLYNDSIKSSNQSQIASFIHLFPAIFIVIALQPRLWKIIGPVAWSVILYLIMILVYDFWGFPKWFTELTLLGRMQPTRDDIGIGLGSIILCVYFIARMNSSNYFHKYKNRSYKFAVAFAIITMSGMTFINGVINIRLMPDIAVTPGTLLLVIGVISILCFAIFTTNKSLLTLMVFLICIIPTISFNPISIGVPNYEQLELAQQIKHVMTQSNPQTDWWASYGEDQHPVDANLPSVLIQTLGGKTLTGTFWYPQMNFWQYIEPNDQRSKIYNRYSQVYFVPPQNQAITEITLSNPLTDITQVNIHPLNSGLKAIGLRYFVARPDQVAQIVSNPSIRLISQTSDQRYAIYEILK